MLTLADVAEVGTAEIPAQWTPSLTVLAAETGLSKRTVQRHLDVLEDEGWIKRDRPDKKAQWFGERVRYTLLCPVVTESTPLASERREGMDTETRVWSESHGGVVTESTTYGHSDHPNQILTSSDLGETSSPTKHQDALFDVEAPETGQDANTGLVLADWIDFLKTKNIELPDRVRGQYAKYINNAVKQKFSERTIKQALARMFDRDQHGSPSQLENFIADVQKAPAAKQPSGPKSTAPDLIPAAEKCEHRRRAATCGLCRAAQIGGNDAA